MQEATSPIKTEAVTAVFYESVFLGKKYPKIQLLTVSELLAEMPVGPKHKAVVYVLSLFALEHNGVKFATQTKQWNMMLFKTWLSESKNSCLKPAKCPMEKSTTCSFPKKASPANAKNTPNKLTPNLST